MELIFSWRLLFCCLVTAVINALNISTGASRIAGVETKRVATAISLYNLFFLFTRLANVVQAPILGNIVDLAAKGQFVDVLTFQIRCIIASATIGSVLGLLLIPTFVEIYRAGIIHFEECGSLPRVLLRALNPRMWPKLMAAFRKPTLFGIRNGGSLKGIPKGFMISNVFVTAIWTVGVLSAVHASVLVPEYVRTASMLSGLVNGIATTLFTLLVDPMAAILTDQAVQELRPKDQIKLMVILLTLGSILGTIIAQLFFLPGAEWIAFATRLLSK